VRVWTAPAERSVDGAFASSKATMLRSVSFIFSRLLQKTKRCRAALAPALQRFHFSFLFRDDPVNSPSFFICVAHR